MAGKAFGPKGWTPERLASLSGKTYVITGATTGIGYEATRVFLSKGARVVMLNRNGIASAAVIAKMKEEFGDNAEISFIHLDLSMMSSVRLAAAAVMEKVPHIDALICNAAISAVARQEITIDGFESHLGVNYIGHFLLCALLFDQIEQSKGRIVLVGSEGYKMGLKRIQFEDLNFDKNYHPLNTYAHSKLALMMFGYELQRRILTAGKSVQVQVCHPGYSRTDLLKGDNIYRPMKIVTTLVSPIIGQSAENGSWPIVLCATEPGLKHEALYGPTKRSNLVGPVDQCDLAEHALDQEAATELWAVSERLASANWSP